MLNNLKQTDPEIYMSIIQELSRQREKIELIASENFTSIAVMEACGCIMTNKYAEGLPSKRYYGGCEHVDVAEQLAIDRAKKIFGAEHANVQPHSGAQANMAVYLALLEPGDVFLGMNLAHGGHLTHGSPVNFSGKYFKIVPYGVNRETETIDYDQLHRLAKEHKPKIIVAGASAYPRTLDFPRFRAIADEVGAYLMTDMAHIAGLVAAGLHPNPVPYCDIVTTTTHKTLRGPRGGMILCKEKYAKAIDKAVFPGVQGGPLMHIIAAKAVALHEAMSTSFQEYQRQVIANARALAKGLQAKGLRIVSGGTDNHLMLVDLQKQKQTGKVVERALDEANITANKNGIPFDPETPFVTSGIRLGTPAVTTRGMKEKEMETIADLISRVAHDPMNTTLRDEIKHQVSILTEKFPLYPELR